MTIHTRVDEIEWMTSNSALREEGLDPDDPAMIAVIDLGRWELAFLSDGHSDRRGGARGQRGDARW